MAFGKLPIHDDDVYVLTARGDQELKSSGTSLSPAEIELLVRTDGISSIARIKASVRTLAPEAADEKLQGLIAQGYIAPHAERGRIGGADLSSFLTDAVGRGPSTQALTRAEADTPTSLSRLRRNGYFVRIARRPGVKQAAVAASNQQVIVVEDEPTLAKFLRQYLAFEGFEVTLAANRAQVVEAFRTVRTPRLVLLDVELPDVDGFDILLKMREHPALKSVPVIMLTAKATREAVLKGLARGANGYVTKPFEADTLVEAVKSVLGMR